MPRFAFCLLVSAVLIGCASRPRDPEAAIAGEWISVGGPLTVRAVFEPNHTFHIDFSANDSFGGTWAPSAKGYALSLSDPRDKRTARIDGLDRLTITPDKVPEAAVTFKRAKSSSSKAALGPPPSGEWRAAYPSKSSFSIPMAPPFATMNFREDGTILIADPSGAGACARPSKIDHGLISMDVGKSPGTMFEMAYRWEGDGNRLMLSIPKAVGTMLDTEWVYLRPEAFHPNGIEGTWLAVNEEEGYTFSYEFRSDGGLSRAVTDRQGKDVPLAEQSRRDYYKLFSGGFGEEASFVQYDAPVKLFSMQRFKLERTDTQLVLTLIIVDAEGAAKLSPKETLVLKRR